MKANGKLKSPGKERRRFWQKLHLAVDGKTHDIICVELSLNNVTDSEAFPDLIRQTYKKIGAAVADGAYDTRLCHDELQHKNISALIPPRKGGLLARRVCRPQPCRCESASEREQCVVEVDNSYTRHSIAERAIYRIKQLFRGSLTLRDYDGQVAEALAIIRALNRITKAVMP